VGQEGYKVKKISADEGKGEKDGRRGGKEENGGEEVGKCWPLLGGSRVV